MGKSSLVHFVKGQFNEFQESTVGGKQHCVCVCVRVCSVKHRVQEDGAELIEESADLLCTDGAERAVRSAGGTHLFSDASHAT